MKVAGAGKGAWMTQLTCQVSGVQIIRSSHNFHWLWTFSANSVFLKSVITDCYCLKLLGLFYFASVLLSLVTALLWLDCSGFSHLEGCFHFLDNALRHTVHLWGCPVLGQELDFSDPGVSLPAQGIWRQNEGNNPALPQPTAHSSLRTLALTAEQGCRESGLRKPRIQLLKWPPSEKHGVNELGYLLKTFLCCKWSHILLMNHAASVV